jgi:peptide/nickel transport system substrate-binding protein
LTNTRLHPVSAGLSRRSVLLGTAGALILGTDRTGGAQVPADKAQVQPNRAQVPPKPGGRFRIGLGEALIGDSHDPATWGTADLVIVGLWGAVYNNLMEIGPDNQLTPELAETVESSRDATTWVFKLRRDVSFHNGKSLDSEDVVASFNHHRGRSSKSAAKPIVDSIIDLKADGRDRVVFTLSGGNADFPVLCTDYHLVIGPAKEGRIDWEPASGTGGYRLVSHERGVRMVLKRNPHYWKSGRAHFEDVELIHISDIAARMNAVITGQVDLIERPDLKSLHLLRQRPEVVIDEVESTQHYTLPMFTDVAPFSDLNVRLALKYAIDRDAMVHTILRGHGSPGNDSPITPANKYFAPDVRPRAYDPDKARYYLRRAGLASLKLDLSASDQPFKGAVDTAVLFKEHAAKAGIDIRVEREPDDGYWTNVWNKKPFCMCFWQGRPSEDWMFSEVYARDAPWNDTHWKNARFNALLVSARAELDTDVRRAMYREMQQLVSDEGGVIVPMFANYVMARGSSVAHEPRIGSNLDLDGWKCIERWWFA